MIPNPGVFDAGPLIAFHQIDCLEWLSHLFERTFVPPEVARESEPSLGELPNWIEVEKARARLTYPRSLGAGERAVIALAVDLSADYVAMDDRRARSVTANYGLTPIGSLGLLVRAKQIGLTAEVRPWMDELIAVGLFVSAKVYQEILVLAGEVSPTSAPRRPSRT